MTKGGKFKVWVLGISFFYVMLCVSGISYAGEGKAGASFLKIGAGVRSAGLGDAFVAVADDASSVYWNPAGLTQLEKIEVTGMYMKWLSDFNYQFIGAAMPIGNFALGLSVIRNAVPPFPEMDNAGNETGSLESSDIAIGASAAYEIIPSLSVGLSGKMVLQTLAGSNATAMLFDIGGLYQISDRIKAGINVQNIGEQTQPFSADSGKEPMPLLIRAGLAAQAFKTDKNELNVAMSLTQPQDGGDMSAHIGVELWFAEYIGLRAGYKIGSPTLLDKFSIGASLKLKLGQIDFAYVPFEELDTTYRIGMTFKL